MYDAAELSQLPGLLAGELISSGRALDSTTRENICAILDAAIARAEVADSLAYERLENLLFVEQRADDAEIERDEAIARAEEAEGRAAELESQLAAQQWRPGSEKPNMPEWYQVGDIDVGVYELWYSGEAWYRSSFQGATYRTPPMSPPNYWRPIPPLPPAPPQEPTP